MRARIAVALVAILALVGGTTPAQEPPPSGWAGQWQSFWSDGAAALTLTQSGDSVSGRYEPGGGQIEGTVEGSVLSGTWRQSGAEGRFVFALSADGQTFTGRYGTGDYWNGRRLVEGESTIARFNSTLSPRETLRAVLAAGNEAVYQGNVAATRFQDRMLVYEGDPADSREQAVRRRLLWTLIDLSTFRLRDMPEPPAADAGEPPDTLAEVVFTIGPAGASTRYPLRFREIDGRWRVVVPVEGELDAALERMLEALGHASAEEAALARADSPRGAIRRFLLGTHDWDGEGRAQALATLDLGYLPAQLYDIQAPVLADYLKRVIDRVGYVIWQEIPDDPDRVQPYEFYRHPVGSVAIARAKDKDGAAGPWRFTADTLRGAPDLYTAMQDLPLAPGIEQAAPFTEFFRLRERIRAEAPGLLARYGLLELWQWLALTGSVLAATLIGWLAARALTGLTRWIVARGRLHVGPDTVARLQWPLAIALGGMTLIIAFGWLGLAQTALEDLSLAITFVTTLAFAVLVFRLIGAVGGHLRAEAEAHPGRLDEIAVSLVAGLLQLVVVVVGLAALAEIVGLPYEGVITGLGVGGIALAFAARDTVSNLLGGAILMADRPFKQGDLIETEAGMSTVEAVGLRSTRMRTLDDTLLIVPNAQLVDKAIFNWGKRRKRKILLQIGLTYNTPRERIDRFVERLAEVYAAQPRADQTTCYVGLSGFGPSSIDIELWGYFRVFGYDAQVAARHALIGDIVDLAKEVGVDFAFPTRTVHLVGEAREPDPA